MTSKILFLDIDGVLNSISDSVILGQWAYSPGGLSEMMIKHLNRIVLETDCEIVMSSTWRNSYSLEFFKGLFVGKGWTRHPEGCMMPDWPPIIGKTPTYFSDELSGAGRGRQIKAYMDDHPGIKYRYVILDDDSDMLEEQLPFFVQTDTNFGLTYLDAEKAIKILNEEP